MRYCICLFTLLFTACGNNLSRDANYTFTLRDKGDTVKVLKYGVLNNYYFFAHPDKLDSVLFSEESRAKIKGEFVFGVIDNSHLFNRFLVFKVPEKLEYEDIHSPEKYFLSAEFDLTSYRLEVLCDSMDSSEPPSYHQVLACLDNETGDTVLFQEMNYFSETKRGQSKSV